MNEPTELNRTVDDRGFTLVELIAAMGIFVVLMALSTMVIVTGMKSIREASAQMNASQEEQNAAEWMSRLIRFTDNPHETMPVTSAVEYAGTNKLTFTTFAGVGDVDRVPYKATLQQTPTGIYSTVWTPTMTDGIPAYQDTNATAVAAVNAITSSATNDVSSTKCLSAYKVCVRQLVPKTQTNTPVLAFKYYTGTPVSSTEVVPGAGASLTEAQRNALRAIEFTITGSQKGQAVSQLVVLENPRS